MPDHPKIAALSDKAFRLLVDTWCWCSRHLTDGVVSEKIWTKRGTPKSRKELVSAGLAETLPNGDIQMHDYLDWQRSAAEVQELREAKTQGGAEGNHIRWHLRRGIADPACDYCNPPVSYTESSHMRSEVRSEDRSEDRSQNDRTPHRKTIAPASHSHRQIQIQNGSSYVGSSSTPLRSDARPPTRGRPSEDGDEIDHATIGLLRDLTGVTIRKAWAAKVRAGILAGRTPDNPAKYVAAAVRKSPHSYLPQTRDPSTRSVAEAKAAALGRTTPPGGDP